MKLTNKERNEIIDYLLTIRIKQIISWVTTKDGYSDLKEYLREVEDIDDLDNDVLVSLHRFYKYK